MEWQYDCMNSNAVVCFGSALLGASCMNSNSMLNIKQGTHLSVLGEEREVSRHFAKMWSIVDV